MLRTNLSLTHATFPGPPRVQTTRHRHKVYDATKKMSAARWAQLKAAMLSAAAERHTRSADGKMDVASVMSGYVTRRVLRRMSTFVLPLPRPNYV